MIYHRILEEIGLSLEMMNQTLLLLWVSNFVYIIILVDMDVEDKPKILVLGGTNFMGKTLIKWFH